MDIKTFTEFVNAIGYTEKLSVNDVENVLENLKNPDFDIKQYIDKFRRHKLTERYLRNTELALSGKTPENQLCVLAGILDIVYNDFCTNWERYSVEEYKPRARFIRAMTFMDKKNTGFIDNKAFVKCITTFGNDPVDEDVAYEMLKELDPDYERNGKLDFIKFVDTAMAK